MRARDHEFVIITFGNLGGGETYWAAGAAKLR